uniref:hypothetical protein n=1 Tax=Paractinoplanes polyasparticus TaxID=2856853 RepID=UPI001C856207|nr:hypothetical protein [Actinoplanes polyasparticus]
MSPDAAEIFAQVNSALLIAFAVESKGLTEDPDDRAQAKTATLYTLGLFGVLLSLAVTLSAVTYDKSLSDWETRIASIGTLLGCVALYNEATAQLARRARGDRKNFRLAAFVMLAGLIWLVFFFLNFVPDPWIWQWF